MEPGQAQVGNRNRRRALPRSPAQAPDFTLRPIMVPLVSGVLASRPARATPAMSS